MMEKLFNRLPMAVKIMVTATAAVACAVAAMGLLLAILWTAAEAGVRM